jgi:hypothetical protein
VIDTEARALATRIANTWRGGPSVTVWTEELADMDPGRAGTTYARLRRDSEHAPSIATFWRTYRELDTDRPDAITCDACSGCGWVHSHEDDHGYSYARPCPHCREGQRTAKLNMRPTGTFWQSRDRQTNTT